MATETRQSRGWAQARPISNHAVAAIACVLLVGLASWLSFRTILRWDFTDIDTFALIATGRVHHWADLGRILSEPLMFDLMPNARFFRPVTSISYGIDERLWGLRAFGYHLTDLVLHTANACLLTVVLLVVWRRLAPVSSEGSRPDWHGLLFGGVAGLLFAVNPAQVDFPPCIARRGDLLAVFFGLVTLAVAALSLGRRSTLATVAMMLFCLLGLASKEIGALIPLGAGLLLLVDAHERHGRAGWRAALRAGWPLIAATAVFLAWRTWVLEGLGGYAPIVGPGIHVRLLRALEAELLMFAAPGHMNALSALFSGHEAIPVGAAVALLAWAIRRRLAAARRGRPLEPRQVWFFATSLLVLLSPLAFGGLEPRQLYFHGLFLSSLLAYAFSWALVELSSGALRRARPRAIAALAMVACVAGVLGTSPLLGATAKLDRFRQGAELARDVLRRAEVLLAPLPAGSKIFLVNFPYRLHFDEDPRGFEQPEVRVFLEHSVQGWADLRFPEKRLDVLGLTYLELSPHWRETATTQVMFKNDARFLQSLVGGGAKVTMFPWPNDYSRHPYPEFFTGALHHRRGIATGRGARIQLAPKSVRGPAYFLIFDRSDLKLETLRDFEVHS